MFELHDYQQRLVDKTRQAYIEGFKSPCVVAPCGAGKSVIISDIARMTTNNNKNVLFLVHRRELIDQIQNTFRKNEVNMNLVQFGMVQTIVRRLEKTVKPDLIITDESHHGLAASYRKIYDYFHGVLRLGFTATPIRLNGSGLGDINDILIEEVDAKWLIENGFLTPYKYYAPKLIDTEQLKLNSLQEFSSSSINQAMQQKTIYGDVVKHYKQLADGEQAIAYCHSIDASKTTKEAFLYHGITAEHIDHVDNVRRHGFPDTKRTWSLESKKTGSKPETRIKECINCFAAYPAESEKCPLCGFVPEVEKEETEYDIDESAELQEVTDEEKQVIELSFKTPDECGSFAELVALGKSLGYKPGWSYYQAKLRGFIR